MTNEDLITTLFDVLSADTLAIMCADIYENCDATEENCILVNRLHQAGCELMSEDDFDRLVDSKRDLVLGQK
jgi:hypothetical protein